MNGKVAFVGAGIKNWGGLISREFAQGGAKVVVHYNSDATRPDAESTVQAIKALGSETYATQGDLTKPANVTALFEQARHHFGGIDIAVNTVGKVLRKPIVDTTEEEYDAMLDINAKVEGVTGRAAAGWEALHSRSRSARHKPGRAPGASGGPPGAVR